MQPGATWTHVTLFIDANRESLGHVAATEWGWGGWGGWGYVALPLVYITHGALRLVAENVDL